MRSRAGCRELADMGTLFIAELDPGVIGVFIPIVAMMVGGLIAVTRMFTNHQRQMAELMRRDVQNPDLTAEIRAMRQEMAEIRNRVNQQTLMIESRPTARPERQEVSERIREQ